jgi:GSH-dependent disulfide-bond oxidoreductase
MIDFYYWTSPNAHKVAMMLEEIEAEYRLEIVNVREGDQFQPDFIAVSPNNKIPAIVDHDPGQGGGRLAMFESGAILLYLAQKAAKYQGRSPAEQAAVRQWLFWQVGGIGPMMGQFVHFANYATHEVPYALDRYANEADRLLGVLDRQLSCTSYVAGDDYSIADMAIYPWIVTIANVKPDLDAFESVRRWRDAIAQRPATRAAYAIVDRVNPTKGPTVHSAEARSILFGQTSLSLAEMQARLAGD